MQYLMCLFKGHKWEHYGDAKMYESNNSTRPLYIKSVYICTKCLKVKKLKLQHKDLMALTLLTSPTKLAELMLNVYTPVIITELYYILCIAKGNDSL